eukprot:gene3096-3293_t
MITARTYLLQSTMLLKSATSSKLVTVHPLALAGQSLRYHSINNLHQIKNKHLIPEAGYINGEFTPASSNEKNNFAVINPANGKPFFHLPRMGVAETEKSIAAATKAFASWKETTAFERSKILQKMASLMHKYKDDLAAIITLEAGKPTAEAKGEVLYAASFLEFYAEEGKRVHGDILQAPARNRRLINIKQPIGPCALITPWNFPSAMITRKLGPALAAGCTAVIKPAGETPLSAIAICAIAHEAGVPPGVVNVVTVDRDEVENVGRTLCHAKDIRKVSFTGSTPVGKWLMREAASSVKKVSLELGGNAPFIVFDDCDIDVAVNALMFAKFRNAGQACIASNRILVQEGIYHQFAEKLTEAASRLKCGDGFDPFHTVGPLINEKGVAKVTQHVQDSVSKGAKVLIGGKPHDINKDGGFFFEPTILSNVTKDMLPFKQETFGPLVPLISFKSVQEAIDLANDTEFGLAAYFCTKDLSKAWHVAEALEAGIIGVNEGAVSLSSTPFGGWKESGLGREGGYQGIEEYLEEKFICMGLGKTPSF